MRTSVFGFVILFTLPQFSFAGGNTSVVRLDTVTSIKIEAEKITIVGSGMLQKRVMSDSEHADGMAFGQPTQWLHAKVTDCEFIVVPYHSDGDLKGVPGPDREDHTPEMKALSTKWWTWTMASAKEVRVGDALTIGYQREKMTITGLSVTKIVGSGSIIPQKEEAE